MGSKTDDNYDGRQCKIGEFNRTRDNGLIPTREQWLPAGYAAERARRPVVVVTNCVVAAALDTV